MGQRIRIDGAHGGDSPNDDQNRQVLPRERLGDPLDQMSDDELLADLNAGNLELHEVPASVARAHDVRLTIQHVAAIGAVVFAGIVTAFKMREDNQTFKTTAEQRRSAMSERMKEKEQHRIVHKRGFQ